MYFEDGVSESQIIGIYKFHKNGFKCISFSSLMPAGILKVRISSQAQIKARCFATELGRKCKKLLCVTCVATSPLSA